ncbi:putative E3 ubiquitin-protein ligase LIN-1 isoform X2 [Jatropha curcas]|uniref:putative E3 ubiquitin-protein ligase LIN-1 isoform X2 n=1 Tax=Jatropha curcas TaxID=180498 RepID=UPI0018930E1D|nr:putative E3 ubiquitin-protein ligase LIN-1 isoform X2 [Jatropha curcas]
MAFPLQASLLFPSFSLLIVFLPFLFISRKMASSLEELLAEEGFRGRRSGMTSRASFRAEAAMKSRLSSEKSRRDSPSGFSGHRIDFERRSSDDLARYILKGKLPRNNSGNSSRRPRDNLVSREKINVKAKKEIKERIFSNDMPNNKTLNSEGIKESEITEIGVKEDARVKDIYSDKAFNSERSETSSELNREKHRQSLSSNKKFPTFGDGNKKIVKKPESSYDNPVRSFKNAKSFEDDQRAKRDDSSLSISTLALDEVAVKAMVSILNSHIKRFLKDEEFRITLHNNCFSSLNFFENEEDQNIEHQVITNLEQAIEVVEKATEGAASSKDLKKASLQLSMIANFNSNNSENGCILGISDSRLSACAHVYLSVIYKLQKKDRVSAKYLLQVFCDSPFSARTLLLPELWEYLFFPHLSHLKVWYNQEADSLLNTPSKIRKLKLLNKVYNEILDSGTYQFAVYYKDWLTEGIEAPSLPSIHIPTMSVHEVQPADSQDHSSGLGRPSDPFSPQPMVSKKLYEAVFCHSTKPGIYEAKDDVEADTFDNGTTTSDSTSVEVKLALTYPSEIVKYLDGERVKDFLDSATDNKFLSDNVILSASKEERKLVEVSVSPETDMNDETRKSNRPEEPAVDGHMLNTVSNAKENVLILKNFAKSIFGLQQTEDSHDLTISAFSHSSEVQPIKVLATYEDKLDGTYEYFDNGSFLESVPQDFICPLTGKLFDNPVTLETGQTFEKEAIKEWFNQGNRTCPVTGKTLECATVPFSNFILKRVIDSWKLEHCSHLLAVASQVLSNSVKHESMARYETTIFILEQLLTTFSREERVANAKHFVSLGGLEFLIGRINSGDLEEKTRVAALISCCIEADASCRNQIARKVDKRCLFELLHSKQPKYRRNAVFLLTELLCLSRRKDVKLFLTGLENEEIRNTMRILLIYLQNCQPEERPWVSMLLLHLDLLIEPQEYSIYKEEAVDAIAMALEDSLTDEKIRENSCRALLALGGRFSASGKSLTESWILNQAGFNNNYETDSEEDDLLLDDSFAMKDEEETINEWLKNLSTSLIGNGKRSFLVTMSKCLAAGNLDLVKTCLTTIAWLSSALSDAEYHISAFSALISRLKENLENGERIEHKVLASMSLLNFKCRVLLMTIAEEIVIPLRRLVEVTWTAKKLYAIISGEYL